MSGIASQILFYFTEFGQMVNRLIGGSTSSQPHYSWIVLLFFVFAIMLIGLSLGRSKMLLGLLAIYIAAYLSQYAGYLPQIPVEAPAYWIRVSIFLTLYLLVFWILNRSLLRTRLSLKESSFPVIGFIALLEIGFLSSILIGYLPEEVLIELPSSTNTYFASEYARIAWAIVPLLATLLLRGKKESSKKTTEVVDSE